METKVRIPSANTYCGNCNSKKAVIRCLDCKEYLCDVCHASHNTWKPMRDHSFVTMEDILSGKVSMKEQKDKLCQVHGKVLAYYCKIEEKTVCQDCVILEAANMHPGNLDRLINEAVKLTEGVKMEIESSSQLAKQSLAKSKKDCIDQLEQIVKKHEAEIDRIRMERLKEIDAKKSNFVSVVKQYQEEKVTSSRVNASRSNYEVIAAYSTLSEQLQKLFQPKSPRSPTQFKLDTPMLSPTTKEQFSFSVRTEASPNWRLGGKFDTAEFNRLLGLSLNQDGDIAVASFEKGAKVFSRAGDVKCTLYSSSSSPGALSVAVTPDNKYVTAPVNVTHITFHDSQGYLLSTAPVTDVNNMSSNVNSVAVDTSGKIIVGQVDNTISIHNPDGSLISKFATQSRPFRLATTSNDEIVSSFCDPILKQSLDIRLMDYSGSNVRVIPPPPEVTEWSPGFICCRQGEIFVVNEGAGDPTGVYRYSSLGGYLGCVTTEVLNPEGIALSKNGMELFVAEYADNMVKIFQRC